MSLNWKEIDKVLEELELPGCHIQAVHEPDYRTLILELYRPGEPFQLLISLAPQATRLHRVRERIRKRTPAPRFAEFLRSRIRGGRIADAHQIGEERLVRLEIARAQETTILWARLWGGAANIIATDSDGTILDAFFRRPNRGEVSGGTFEVETVIGSRGRSNNGQTNRTYRVRELAGDGDFNDRVAAEYRAREREAEIDRLKARLSREYAEKEARIRATIEKLSERAREYAAGGQQKLYGDLIMANLYRLHRGDHWLVAENYEENNREIRIQLDPALTPSANAEAYYDRFKKAHAGLTLVEEEIEHLEQTLSTMGETSTRVLESGDLQLLRSEVRDLAQSAVRSRSADDRSPGLEFRSGPYRILVGRSAAENEYLLRRAARGNDIWLHTRDYPGAYVVVKHIPGKSIPLETLLDAGNLAVFYSKARSSGFADLYYTHVKYLRRPKEGKRGLVLPTQEKNLSVRLEAERLERMQADRRQA